MCTHKVPNYVQNADDAPPMSAFFRVVLLGHAASMATESIHFELPSPFGGYLAQGRPSREVAQHGRLAGESSTAELHRGMNVESYAHAICAEQEASVRPCLARRHTVPPGAPPIRIGSLTRPRRGRPAILEPPKANVLRRSASMSGATVGQGRMALTAASSTRSAVLSKDFGGAHLSVEFGRASKSARHGAAVGGVRASPAPWPMRWVR